MTTASARSTTVMLHCIIFMLAVVLSAIASQVAATPSAEAEIGALLDYLDHSGCAFSRNGTWYSASVARAHLERKYRYLHEKGLIGTTEDFINRAARASSMSGKPYQVKCDGIEAVSSAEWLTAELQRLRRPSAAMTP